MLNVEASSLKNEMKTQCFSTTFHVRRLWKRLREFSFSCTLSCVEAWLRQGTSISSIISCEGRGAWGVDHCRSRYLLDQDLSCSPARTKWSAGEIPHVYLDLVEDLFLGKKKSYLFGNVSKSFVNYIAFLFSHTEIAYIRRMAAKSIPPFVLIDSVHPVRLVKDRGFNGTERDKVT